MSTIQVEKIVHKNENRLSLRFPFDKTTIELIKTIPDRRWSHSLNVWHVPDTTETKVELAKLTSKDFVLRWVDPIEVNPANQNNISTHSVEKPKIIVHKEKQAEPLLYENSRAIRIAIEPKIMIDSEIEKYSIYLKQRRYSPNTIRIYTEGLKLFLQFTAKPILEVTNNDLERFNHDYIIKNRYSSSFQNPSRFPFPFF